MDSDGGTDRLRSDDSSVLTRFSQVHSPTSLLAAERGKDYPLLLELNWNWEQEFALGLGGMKSQTWYWLVSATLLNSTVNCEFGLY